MNVKFRRIKLVNTYDVGHLRRLLKKYRTKTLIKYYEGFIFYDREHDENVDLIAKEAWQLYEEGLVHLLQKRIGECAYIYYVVKR